MELYIVRHAESLSNTGEENGFDTKLSKKGLVQADELGRSLSGIRFDKIYASHLCRAIQTAAGAAKHQPGEIPIEIVPELAECGIDPLWDCDVKAHREIYPHLIYTKTRIEDIYANDSERAEAALEKCAYPIAYESGFTSVNDSNEGEVCSNDVNVLVVAHGMYNAWLLSRLVKFPFDVNMVVEQHNTCVNHLSMYTVNGVRRVKFKSFNDYHHLSEDFI